MTTPTLEDIAHFASVQYQYWNDGKWDELFAAYDKIAPNGYTIQYFGKPVTDGRAALDKMIRNVAGKVRTNVREVLVNEGEAVVIVGNEVLGTDVETTSIERYLFKDGKVACSYFHDAAEGVRMGKALGVAH